MILTERRQLILATGLDHDQIGVDRVASAWKTNAIMKIRVVGYDQDHACPKSICLTS